MTSNLAKLYVGLMVSVIAAAGCGSSGNGNVQSSQVFNEVYSCDEGGTCVDQDVMDSFTFEVLANGMAQTVEGGNVIFSGPFDAGTGVFGPWTGNGCDTTEPCDEMGTWTFVDGDGDGQFDSFSGPSSYAYTQMAGGGDCASAGNSSPTAAPASAGSVGSCP